eukprot:gene11200-7774_t
MPRIPLSFLLSLFFFWGLNFKCFFFLLAVIMLPVTQRYGHHTPGGTHKELKNKIKQITTITTQEWHPKTFFFGLKKHFIHLALFSFHSFLRERVGHNDKYIRSVGEQQRYGLTRKKTALFFIREFALKDAPQKDLPHFPPPIKPYIFIYIFIYIYIYIHIYIIIIIVLLLLLPY